MIVERAADHFDEQRIQRRSGDRDHGVRTRTIEDGVNIDDQQTVGVGLRDHLGADIPGRRRPAQDQRRTRARQHCQCPDLHQATPVQGHHATPASGMEEFSGAIADGDDVIHVRGGPGTTADRRAKERRT